MTLALLASTIADSRSGFDGDAKEFFWAVIGLTLFVVVVGEVLRHVLQPPAHKGRVYRIDWSRSPMEIMERHTPYWNRVVHGPEPEPIAVPQPELVVEAVAAPAPQAPPAPVEPREPAEPYQAPAEPTIVINVTEAAPAAPPLGHTPVYFEAGEPTTFDEFAGQEHITGELSEAVWALDDAQCAIAPQMFVGPPGMGKTTLAKILTNELRFRNMEKGFPEPAFVEVVPVDLGSVDELDARVRQATLSKGSVLFIDEAHDLIGPHVSKLLKLLQEKKYQFKDASTPVAVRDLTVLGATTDIGLLPPALRRRFVMHHFHPATPDQLKGYVMARPYPIDNVAADLIVSRTHFGGAAWEALQLRGRAETRSRARVRRDHAGPDRITMDDVRHIIDVLAIDELGLGKADRNILAAMYRCPRFKNGKGSSPEFVCYGESMENVCQMAGGIDVAYYRTHIRPRLMSRGLIRTRAGYGQTLTDRGITHHRAHSVETA